MYYCNLKECILSKIKTLLKKVDEAKATRVKTLITLNIFGFSFSPFKIRQQTYVYAQRSYNGYKVRWSVPIDVEDESTAKLWLIDKISKLKTSDNNIETKNGIFKSSEFFKDM